MSSYVGKSGSQVPAAERLRDRMLKHTGTWKVWQENLHGDSSVDQAVGEISEDGLLWIHVYLVWSHLTVYATISGPPDIVRRSDNWAMECLREIGTIVH
jgi:hypothetical protein